MTISEWPTAPSLQAQQLSEQLAAAENHIELLEESYADLALAAEDQGWTRLGADAEREFDRQGLGQIARNCRVMAIASPTIKRGLGLRGGYVWGQGVQVAARDDDVNEVVQAFWDDPSNRAAFTSSQAQEENERALGTDGNFFLAFFTHPIVGKVQVRSTPFDEITDVITNPEDRDEPWFYLRQYTTTVYERGYTGLTRSRRETRRVLHPALGYRPAVRPKSIDGVAVEWDVPILHVPVNRLDGWKFGVPDAYAALPWARAYEGFLTDWAKIVKALSKFAWRLTGDKASKVRRAASAAAAATQHLQPAAGSGAGQAAAYGPGVSLEAIPKSGATIDSESGKPLAAMVAAALGLPVTMLLADPGVTGARAVAETLDTPTENEFGLRQKLWASVIQTVTSYVIDQAVKARRGPLAGTVTRDEFGREVVTLAGDLERTVEVKFPPLSETDPVKLLGAIVEAEGTRAGQAMPLVMARLILQALGVDDIDELLAPGSELVDEDGNFRDPDVTAGDEATRRFRRGEDPAESLR